MELTFGKYWGPNSRASDDRQRTNWNFVELSVILRNSPTNALYMLTPTLCSWIRASWYNYENNQRGALYRLIYYSKSAVHVSGDVFAHHQEHLTVFTVSGSVHPSCLEETPAGNRPWPTTLQPPRSTGKTRGS